MHEPAIVAELINLVKEEITRAGYPQGSVSSVTVKIGALHAVVEESLQFAFDVLKADTPLENASLIVENSPIHGICRRCCAEFSPSQPIFICSVCGSGDLDLQAGNELDLISLNIETE